uniref:Uncharacterized protein n=1 Tax=Romanomermis culicivorax TaxID=13658 RepID=A0A915KW40_ROMCU
MARPHPRPQGSVTYLNINDYANAALRKDAKRVSKSKQIFRETKDWWELENADLGTSDDEDEKGLLKRRSRSSSDSNTSSRRQKRTTPVFDQTYRQYGIDIWFAIAAHLIPDDVGRFALICKETHFVTTTALFWKILHRRTAFLLAINLNETRCQKLYNIRVRCKLYWYETLEMASGKVYTYFFKFAEKKCRDDSRRNLKGLYCLTDVENKQRQMVAVEFGYARSELPKGLQFLNDIFANLESECFILKISSSHFTNVPSILGMHLNDINVVLNCDMRTHRVKLRFQTTSAFKNSVNRNERKNLGQWEVISINNVQSLVVLDWWSPSYPLPVL